jgi:GTP-dependent phosphoenolpyruvate carboxykinase
VEELEERPPFVSEGEDRAAPGILLELVGNRVVQAVEAAAHVARFDRHEHFQAAGKTQHGREWFIDLQTMRPMNPPLQIPTHGASDSAYTAIAGDGATMTRDGRQEDCRDCGANFHAGATISCAGRPLDCRVRGGCGVVDAGG